MRENRFHVVPNLQGGWSIIRFGAYRPMKKFDTLAQAKTYGQELASKGNVELAIHDRGGMVRDIQKIEKKHVPVGNITKSQMRKSNNG